MENVPAVLTQAAEAFGLDPAGLRDLGGASGATWGTGDRILRLGTRAGLADELVAMAAAAGVLPVPAVYGQREIGDHAAALLERLPGRPAAVVAASRPAAARDIGRACGAIHGLLAGVAGPARLRRRGRDTGTTALLHLDLHPLNVLVGDDGAVTGVLDWANTAAGDPLLDRARTWSILTLDPLVRARRAEPWLAALIDGWTEAADLASIPAWARAGAIRFLLTDLSARYRPDELSHAQRALADAEAEVLDEAAPLELRRAQIAEAADLRALAVAAYQRYVHRIGRLPAPMTADYTATVLDGEVWVADQDGVIAGLIVLVREPGHLLIENLAVRPAAQSSGIGSRLLRLAEERAREYGLPELRLYTNEAMTENIAYYPRRGYTETHRDEQHGFRRVYFTKPTPPE